ncbi:MAG: threonylcarbamoyl-AMP synthase [Acidobacteria bacterium]|nr:threonylcarbamoyl-AMP synthase [Acidobacteriota bacterium]
MKRLRLSETDRMEALREAAAVVHSGGILLYPTDTIYGLGCDPFLESAVKRLSEIKRRKDSQVYLVLIRDPMDATRLVSKVPQPFSFLGRRLWPGPITMIFEKDPGAPPFPGSDSIGIRCPRWTFLRDFLRITDAPLISTSANLSGETPILDPDEAYRQFAGQVDLFLDFGKLPHNRPSTILDIRADPPQVLREGAMLQRVRDAIIEWQAQKPDSDSTRD